MILSLSRHRLDLSGPVVMGVLNVTPDSFSDGGQHRTLDAALHRAEAMLAEGAGILDVGGESTRPGAEPVSEHEELARVVPVIEALTQRFDCIISVDTMKPAVMRAAAAAGAEVINDVFGLRAPGAIEAVRDTGTSAVLMHMQGEPRTMQHHPHYGDVVAEVEAFLLQRAEACVQAGVARERLMLDPGFGFGKSLDHNLALFAALDRLSALGFPLLVGVSRKAMFGHLLGLPVAQRTNAGAAAAALAVASGAAIIRTHDVAPTVEAVRFAAAVRDRRAARGSETQGLPGDSRRASQIQAQIQAQHQAQQ